MKMVSPSDRSINQAQRIQFPLVPAEAMTIHKSQGQTYEKICLDFTKNERIPRQMLYVALSRVTKLSGLYIIGHFKAPNPRPSDDPVALELQKLNTYKKLVIAYNNLIERRGLTIGYHNIVSYKQYYSHIKKDPWYYRCDVLIFSETLTMKTQTIELKGYNIAFRTDAFRGILCFVKADLNFENIQCVCEESGACFFSLSINAVTVISGYAHPNCTSKIFQKKFEQIYEKMSQKNENIILLGDFNINIKSNCKKGLKEYLEKFKMKSLLRTATSTTNNNTQIDIVFANVPHNRAEAGVYESYFSDHKPVYCILLDENKCSQQSREKNEIKSHNKEVKNDEKKTRYSEAR